MMPVQRRPAGKGSSVEKIGGAANSDDTSSDDTDGSTPSPSSLSSTLDPLIASSVVMGSSSTSNPLLLQQQYSANNTGSSSDAAVRQQRRRNLIYFICLGGLVFALTALFATVRSSTLLDRSSGSSSSGSTMTIIGSRSSTSSQEQQQLIRQEKNDEDDDTNHLLLRTSNKNDNNSNDSSNKNENNSNNNEVNSNNNDDNENNDCTVWLAPSSLGEGSGYGLYTTRDLPAGSSILGGPDGAGVPLENCYQKDTPHAAERKVWRRVWKRYWWEKGVPGHVWFESTDELGGMADYQVGIGALPNHHCILYTLSFRFADPPYDDSLVSRFRDASAGAFTYNRGREFIVKDFRPAGSELFLNYGYCDRKEHMPYFGDMVSVTDDYYKAASLVMKRGALKFDDTDGSLIIPDDTPMVVARLLPKTKSDREALLKDKPKSKDDLVERIALQSLDQRTPEWIRENGICLQNLLARTSTIAGAGQGAFAQRTIRKGEIVAPASLMQVVDKNALNLYDADGTRVGTQLLINYCFGHAQSSMLLCPNTNAVLINHCSAPTKDCGPSGPNAIYQWSSGWDPTSDAWRRKTIAEIAEERGRGLAFEIVALRDILPNEEVFIDYGVEWEQAWAQHRASWKPPQLPPTLTPGSWITAKEANEMEGPIMDAFVSGDLRRTVDHPYLFTGCQFYETDFDSHDAFRAHDVNWKNMTDLEIMGRFANWEPNKDAERGYARHRSRSFWPCTVIRREDNADSLLYTVRIHQNDVMDELPWHRHNLPRFLINFPRTSIHYFVRPLASDQHLPGVFRHPIGIREELFPEHWKNLKGTQD